MTTSPREIRQRAIELCIRYAVEAEVASVSQSILQRVSCDYACKTTYPVYSSDFVCVDPGEAGRLACTLMTAEDLAKEDEGGICDNCKEHRIPALNDLREAKKRMAKTRKEIVSEGNRLMELERQFLNPVAQEGRE